MGALFAFTVFSAVEKYADVTVTNTIQNGGP